MEIFRVCFYSCFQGNCSIFAKAFACVFDCDVREIPRLQDAGEAHNGDLKCMHILYVIHMHAYIAFDMHACLQIFFSREISRI